MTRERISKLPDDDWRKHDPDFNEPELSAHLALVERLRAVGKRRRYAPGAVAVAWTLRHSSVTAAIVGRTQARAGGRRGCCRGSSPHSIGPHGD